MLLLYHNSLAPPTAKGQAHNLIINSILCASVNVPVNGSVSVGSAMNW